MLDGAARDLARASQAPDVVVVGAGPSGCAAALALAERGVAVLLVEQGPEGKDKPCGDAWTPSAVSELSTYRIGAREVGERWRPFARIDGYYSGRKVWGFVTESVEGAVAPRAIVDQLLRDRVTAAGSQIRYGARVMNLTTRPGGLDLVLRQEGVTSTLRPSAVVLASGSGCRLSRAAGLDGEPEFGASVSAYVPVEAPVPAPAFLFGEPAPGYAWVFPAGERLSNVGVCGLTKPAASTLREQMREQLARLGSPPDVSLRGGLGAMWTGAGARWRHDAGVVSCGDAAGLVDPTSGEGLTAALVSGKRSGEAIARFLAGASSALAEYSEWVSDWAASRYRSSLEGSRLAVWVGHAPAERRLLALLAGLKG